MTRIRLALVVVVAFLLASSDLIAQGRFNRNPDRDIAPKGSRVQYKSFYSDLLNRHLPYALYLPPSYEHSDREYPVVFFLHGANENERRWSTRGLTDILLDRMVKEGAIGEFIVAIPFGANSFYTNSISGDLWEDMITKEFVPMIESTTRSEGSRGGRAVSGISMGGYGALKLAFKHPHLFSSVSAHSPMLIEDFTAIDISKRQASRFYSIFDDIFGLSKDISYWNKNDPLQIAQHPEDFDGLRIYFDCGTEDEYGFQNGAIHLSEVLTSKKIDHEFHLYPGSHGWDYAKRHIGASLKFHWNVLNQQ